MRVYTRNRSEAVSRLLLAHQALDEALVRARREEDDAEFVDAVEWAVSAVERARAVALGEEPDL